jgi:hypothetical protein
MPYKRRMTDEDKKKSRRLTDEEIKEAELKEDKIIEDIVNSLDGCSYSYCEHILKIALGELRGYTTVHLPK